MWIHNSMFETWCKDPHHWWGVFSQKTKQMQEENYRCMFNASFEVHTRKPWQPNWEQGEIMAFIKAKRDEHVAALNKVDPWNQFEIVVTKWKLFLLLWCLQVVLNTWEMDLHAKTNGVQSQVNSKIFLNICLVLGRMRIISHWTYKTRLPFICPS